MKKSHLNVSHEKTSIKKYYFCQINFNWGVDDNYIGKNIVSIFFFIHFLLKMRFIFKVKKHREKTYGEEKKNCKFFQVFTHQQAKAFICQPVERLGKHDNNMTHRS